MVRSNKLVVILWTWWWCIQDRANLAMWAVRWLPIIITTSNLWITCNLFRISRCRIRRTSTSSTCQISRAPQTNKEVLKINLTAVAVLASKAYLNKWESHRSRATKTMDNNNNNLFMTMSSSLISRCKAVRPQLASIFLEVHIQSALLAVIYQLLKQRVSSKTLFSQASLK